MRHLFVILVAVVAVSTPSSATPPVLETRPSPRQAVAFTQDSHAGHAQDAHHDHRLSLAVDGAATPEAIPDDWAWAQFLSAMARAETKVLDAALGQVGLDGTDRAAFVWAVAPLKAGLKQPNDPPSVGLSVVVARSQQRQALINAQARVQNALTTTGLTKLDAYIRTRVKQQIRIYSGPMAAKSDQGGAR